MKQMKGVSDILQANLENIGRRLRDDWDWVVCLDGYERVGKSTLAMQMNLMVDDRFEDDGIDRIVFDWNKLRKTARESRPYSAIWYDEARMLTRERLSPWNVAMVRTLSIVGFKNDFFDFNFPDFWELDPYIKDHRCRTRVLVKSYHGNRGYSYFWVASKRPFKTKKGRSTWWKFAFPYHFDSFEDRRSEWYEYRHLWREYQRLEREAKTSILDEDGIDWRATVILNTIKGGGTQADAARALGCSQPHIVTLTKKFFETSWKSLQASASPS